MPFQNASLSYLQVTQIVEHGDHGEHGDQKHPPEMFHEKNCS